SLIRLLEKEYKILGSRRILEMLADDIESLQREYFPVQDRLTPGMICWVTTKRTTRKPSYGKKAEDYDTVTVYLPLITEEDINKRVYLRNGDRNEYYTRCKEREIATMVRIIRVTWEQGGMLCQAEIAVLLNRSLTTVRKYLAEYQAQHPEEALPLKGYILDQGSRPTHKGIILTLYEQGIDPTDITNRTNHGLDAVDRYIVSYNRVKELYRKGLSREEIKKVTGLALKTIDQYLRIAVHFHPEIKERWRDSTKK
ncbi:MAG: DUF1670 domain-containing protein, partial [bacterium]